MAETYNDRVVDENYEEVPEIPELCERVILFALDEGKKKLLAKEMLVPFTVLAVKDNLFIETHPGESAEDCYAMAKHTVGGARGADAYAFCYDGYVDTDAGMKDCIIAEGGVPGGDGYAVGYLYEVDEESGIVVVEADPAYIGEAPNFMEDLCDSSVYAEDDIDPRYLDGEGFEDGGNVYVEEE